MLMLEKLETRSETPPKNFNFSRLILVSGLFLFISFVDRFLQMLSRYFDRTDTPSIHEAN